VASLPHLHAGEERVGELDVVKSSLGKDVFDLATLLIPFQVVVHVDKVSEAVQVLQDELLETKIKLYSSFNQTLKVLLEALLELSLKL
jgi:hypothetical protein